MDVQREENEAKDIDEETALSLYYYLEKLPLIDPVELVKNTNLTCALKSFSDDRRKSIYIAHHNFKRMIDQMIRIKDFIVDKNEDGLLREIALMVGTVPNHRCVYARMNQAYLWDVLIPDLDCLTEFGTKALDYVFMDMEPGAMYGPVEREGMDQLPVRAREDYGSSILHVAVFQPTSRDGSKWRIIEILLKHGCMASLFWTDNLGLCPVHWALLVNDLPLTRCLLRIMEKLWYKDEELIADPFQTKTPLRCSKLTFKHILQKLFEMNLRCTCYDRPMYTVLQESLQLVHLSVNDFYLLDPVFLGKPWLVSRMLAGNCDVQAPVPQFFDPLHCCASLVHSDKDQLLIMEILLRHGADPNRLVSTKSWYKRVFRHGAPLHFLLEHVPSVGYLCEDTKTAVGLLLTNGADLHLRNNDQQTCFHFFNERLRQQLVVLVMEMTMSTPTHVRLRFAFEENLRES